MVSIKISDLIIVPPNLRKDYRFRSLKIITIINYAKDNIIKQTTKT